MNPYQSRPDYTFWRRSVSEQSPLGVDPITHVPFRISRRDQIATAGSCFAQHIARTLSSMGFGYLVTEVGPGTVGAKDENYGVFPARFGNLYTARQLLQLFQRAYGLFEPVDGEWEANESGYLDPFRPRIQHGGFESIEQLRTDREHHLVATREMFERCDHFIFTLGLTEGWRSVVDGAVFPLAPGVVTDRIDNSQYEFHNFTVGEVEADMLQFIDHLRSINPSVRVLLTVSPVPLIATFEDRHVLVSTVYSKSVLRVAADAATRARPKVAYFPSYEIITGAQARSQFYEDDLREVSDAGVTHVMSIFVKHFTVEDDATYGGKDALDHAGEEAASPADAKRSHDKQAAKVREWQQVICDEEALDPSQ
jgi:hypothetical protein